MRGYYVLENKLGQVVRTFNCETDDLTLIYLNETRRIEAVSSTKDLEEQEIEFVELLQTTKACLQKKAMAVGDVGSIRYLEEIEKLSPSIEMVGDSPEQFKTALKWTAGVQVALLLLIFLIGHFVKVSEEVPQPQLVTVVPRKETPKPKVQKMEKVVEVTEKKIVTKHYSHHVTPHKVTKLAKVRPNVQYRANKNVALNNNGAQSIFGALEKSNQDGGVAVNNVKTSKGAGLGGSEGSGGIQTSVYGSGLISAPLGPQAKASGAGGYGTHGKGGGQAGYGKMSLVGSSNAFFQPVEEEASVEGGLDRDEIAAVIQRHLGQIRFCYEQGLNIKSNLNGRVAIRFFINAGGHVNTANIANTSLHSSDVESCIVDRLKSWKFPEPRGGVIVKVTYPFVLKRVSQS
jgi:outer membrane biosynthesis protein TonB